MATRVHLPINFKIAFPSLKKSCRGFMDINV